ncbi:S10 family peptidase [Granulicella cerasi]|uniref:S10 family peptidase n=1 Tax=Granulicella cerasi TaxID=741063 RepID=UPI0021DFBBB9|nr:peptidase S10 [Granulicella cerasi]
MTFLLRRPSALALPLAAAFTMAPALLAQQHHAPAPAGEKQTTTVTTEPAKPAAPSAVVPDAVSEGSVTVGGKKIDYRAVAGLITVGANDTQDATIGLDGRVLPEAGVDLPAKVEDQPATARIFYTAYFAKGADPATRPVVFIYNGGPGSATMYLRMSSIGPVRVELPDLQHPFGGPYKLVNNDDSLLDVADLVFIDAPGTGYSRVQGRDAMKAFYGIDEDASAFDRFIRRWLSKNDRWMSPKFLFGESYGTTRDAALSRKLQQSGVDLNGVVFLSQILSFQNSADGSDRNPGNENGFFLALPSFAATAWFHHKVPGQPATLEPWIHEVEQYAVGEYAAALLQGADLDPAKKAAVAAKLESYTGIPASLWVKANLRLSGGEFSKYLQESAGITTGRLDSRFEGPAMDPLSKESDYDPFTESIESAIYAAQNHYAHATLHFGDNMTYKPSAREPGFNWNMRNGRGQANVMGDLAYTLKVNPKMHILLMGGYFDLGTLYFASEFEMKHLQIPAELQKNIDYKFFPTGHMVYINPDARKALHDKTAAFIKGNEDATK